LRLTRHLGRSTRSVGRAVEGEGQMEMIGTFVYVAGLQTWRQSGPLSQDILSTGRGRVPPQGFFGPPRAAWPARAARSLPSGCAAAAPAGRRRSPAAAAPRGCRAAGRPPGWPGLESAAFVRLTAAALAAHRPAARTKFNDGPDAPSGAVWRVSLT